MPHIHPFRLAILVAVALLPGKAALNAADRERGRILFQQTCALCHATGLEKLGTAGQGPILGGVVGRPAASLPNFSYSAALQKSGLTWSEAALDQFLANPPSRVPGTAMVIAVPQAADRADLIAYLKTLPKVAIQASKPTPPSHRGASPGDWTQDRPGAVHSIQIEDLPRPFATAAARNSPDVIKQPAGAALAVPPGFEVRAFISGLVAPRLLRTAPNGDLFVAESQAGRVRVLRAAEGAASPSQNSVFAANLQGPFGIAFYPLGEDPKWVYVATLNSVVRYPYRNGDLAARGPAETVVPQLSEHTRGGHVTRDIVFSLDGRKLIISVGSASNVAEGIARKSPSAIRAWEAEHGVGADWGYESSRADILQTDPEGRTPLRTYATGIRNGVGLAVDPATGVVWVSTNERDGLGDDLVPDYVSRVREGGFYGWPWYYMGSHEDPRHPGARPDLAGKAIVPDVPVQAHSASLQLAFYSAVSGSAAFPAEYRGNVFAAFHGSWNRSVRTGSKVIRIRVKDGVPDPRYEDFLTGFVVDNQRVWGRPVGLAVGRDGALFVSDDAGGVIWRISYRGSP